MARVRTHKQQHYLLAWHLTQRLITMSPYYCLTWHKQELTTSSLIVWQSIRHRASSPWNTAQARTSSPKASPFDKQPHHNGTTISFNMAQARTSPSVASSQGMALC
eukprot:1156745-Pelagomonas_calceolata.AAC.5